MSNKQMIERINMLLDKFDARLAEVEFAERQAPNADASPAYLRGKREMLALVCLDLETLLMEVGQP